MIEVFALFIGLVVATAFLFLELWFISKVWGWARRWWKKK